MIVYTFASPSVTPQLFQIGDCGISKSYYFLVVAFCCLIPVVTHSDHSVSVVLPSSPSVPSLTCVEVTFRCLWTTWKHFPVLFPVLWSTHLQNEIEAAGHQRSRLPTAPVWYTFAIWTLARFFFFFSSVIFFFFFFLRRDRGTNLLIRLKKKPLSLRKFLSNLLF